VFKKTSTSGSQQKKVPRDLGIKSQKQWGERLGIFVDFNLFVFSLISEKTVLLKDFILYVEIQLKSTSIGIHKLNI